MAGGMAAYVAWAVIHRQRAMDAYLASAAAGRWQEEPIVPPARHRVGIAGLGTLGEACARALLALGYAVRGWSRTPRPAAPAQVESSTAPPGWTPSCPAATPGVPAAADRADARLPRRRGVRTAAARRTWSTSGAAPTDEDALLAALATGQLGAATLDAFVQEPLPAGHPFWHHPRIVVTPHVATRTDAAVIARQTLDNLALARRGLRPPAAVDPAQAIDGGPRRLSPDE